MKKKFIPAARFHFLTRFYDGFVTLFFSKIYRRIVETIKFPATGAVLDVACGPGNLLIQIHKKHPPLKLVGLDIDPEILKFARQKTKKLTNVELVEASATKMPFPDEHFDLALSTLAFHHLTTEQKQQAFHEIFRLLKKGGTFWLYDFAQPKTRWGKIMAAFYRLFEEVDDGVQGKLPIMYEKAGFKNIQTHWSTQGLISLLSGEKL